MTRRWILALLFVVLLAPALLLAGTIVIDFGAPVTITTTAAQNAKLTRALADYNAMRVQSGQSTVTMEGFLRQMILDGVQAFINQASANEQAEACAAYQALAAGAKTQIDTALGGKSPCR